MLRVAATVLLLLALVPHANATSRSTPIALAPDGSAVWVTNPDSNTVAKIDPATHTRLGEFPAGDGPRTLAVTSDAVYVASQHDDAIIRLGLDGSATGRADLGFGCAPYAIVAAGHQLYVTCEGPSTLVVLDTDLHVLGTVPLAWPEARALAVADTGLVYVTHFLTKEPNNSGHVSEVDPAASHVARVLEIPPDFATCETLGSGQGIANLLGAVVVGSGATAGQLWVGGTLHNALRKGLFERSTYFKDKPGVGLFPFDFQSNPAGEHDNARRNIYKPARHDIARGAIWKLDLGSGQVRARLDLAGGGSISALTFSASGDVAYAVDLMANGYYVFNTARGEGANAATLFGASEALREALGFPIPPGEQDSYDRSVAVCTVDNIDLADWLVRNGLAFDWPRYSKNAYAEAQRQAEQNERGLWTGSFSMPWQFRACVRKGGRASKCSDESP